MIDEIHGRNGSCAKISDFRFLSTCRLFRGGIKRVMNLKQHLSSSRENQMNHVSWADAEIYKL